MKKAGIIGGMDPASTIEYYQGIADGYRGLKGGESIPSFTLENIDGVEASAFITQEN